MYKIRGRFLKTNTGSWVNYKLIAKFYVGGCDDTGYRVCFVLDITDPQMGYNPYYTDSTSFGNAKKTYQEAQEFLDHLMGVFEQEE